MEGAEPGGLVIGDPLVLLHGIQGFWFWGTPYPGPWNSGVLVIGGPHILVRRIQGVWFWGTPLFWSMEFWGPGSGGPPYPGPWNSRGLVLGESHILLHGIQGFWSRRSPNSWSVEPRGVGPWDTGVLGVPGGPGPCSSQHPDVLGVLSPPRAAGSGQGGFMAAGLDTRLSPALSHCHPTGAPCHPPGCGAPLSPPAWSGVGWGWPVTGAMQPPPEVSPPLGPLSPPNLPWGTPGW